MPRRLTTEEFISKALIVHGMLYDYSKVVYLRTRDKVIVKCLYHGDFLQTPDSHLSGRGCPKCSVIRVGKTRNVNAANVFVLKAKHIHDNKYDYSKTSYGKSNIEKITIICKHHGEFKQIPSDHLQGKGCPKCVSVISNPETKFLDYVGVPNTNENRQIRICGKRVDGYIDNVVYEFLGDYWHGNPARFNPTNIHPRIKKSFGDIYDDTMTRFKKIKDAGYQIKYVWESDWKKFQTGHVFSLNIQSF